MMATCSTDQTVKIWDIATDNPNNKPKCVYTKEMNQGDLFSLQFYKDIPWVLAAGGSMGQLAIWDTEECSVIKQHFKDSVNKNAPIVENASITTDAPSAKSKQTESKDEDFEDVSDEDSEDEMQDD
jgi:WD40 repeat protein